MTRSLEPDPQRLLDAHAAANEFYRARLLSEPRALAYLRSRGIVAAVAHTPPWTLGYAPRGWTHLHDHLREAGYTDEELLAAGLVTPTGNGNLIDVFRNRVTFPIRNPDGHIVAFTGRDLSGRANTPKYRNTATTAIYRKSELLYGLSEQLGGDTQPAAVMLVEGPADVVAVARLRQSLGADQYRRPYTAVAPCGTALTAAQVARLTEAVPPGTPIVVAFDPDNAGHAAAEKAYTLLCNWPGPVDAIALLAGTDPAELIAHGRASAVQTMEQSRRPLADLLVDQRLSRYRLDEIPGRFAALHAAAPLVVDIAARDPAHAARLSAHLATRLDLNPLTIFEAVYPPADDAEPTDYAAPAPDDSPVDPPNRSAAMPLGGAGFPHPEIVGHQYARVCPPAAPATAWVQHDPVTGHTAWVLAEGVADAPGDRDAARIAAEVAGRAAVLIGARRAVELARTALNAHFAQPGTRRGDAAITVLTSFDGEQPTLGRRPFTVAWAGDITAYGTTSSQFTSLTASHNLRAHARRQDPAAASMAGDAALTASVRGGGTIGVNRIDTPLHQIVLVGRALAHTDPGTIRRAVEWRSPAKAIRHLAELSDTAAALAIRPRPDRVVPALTAAQLARQDQTANSKPPQPALSARAARLALPAAPARHTPTR
ncbi:DNA primase [Phytohabitans aurantiacus]|uniref:Toprim domain-containing protein n=1 Tax=Phytohabitans aurantiacus TaxID=3016789 RepID=A0ABQ5R5T9_9ACTN|nr:DNA primase [Phytohabitans aurantiacus]GLI00921.1 hypothetical protein Pa4123_61970 [Phytohabitans aurantiacus]